MRPIESFNDKVAREKSAAASADMNSKLDAILAHLKLDFKSTYADPGAAPEDKTHEQSKEGEVAGVPGVNEVQRKVPAKVEAAPSIRVETGPMEGGRANGEKPNQIGKGDPFPAGTPMETKTAVIGALQGEQAEKAAEAKKV